MVGGTDGVGWVLAAGDRRMSRHVWGENPTVRRGVLGEWPVLLVGHSLLAGGHSPNLRMGCRLTFDGQRCIFCTVL